MSRVRRAHRIAMRGAYGRSLQVKLAFLPSFECEFHQPRDEF